MNEIAGMMHSRAALAISIVLVLVIVEFIAMMIDDEYDPSP
jgi:hypothetical protein